MEKTIGNNEKNTSVVEKFPHFRMSINEFYNLKEKGLLRFDLAYQRGERLAWRKPEHVEAYLDSIFKGYPFPSIYLVKINNIWYVLDGQQRLTTAFAIRQSDCVSLPLSSEKSIFNESMVSVAGNHFLVWTGGFREKFLNYEFDCVDCSAMDEDEQAVYFARLNGGGVKLTYAESQKGRYHKTWARFEKVFHHSFWEKYNVKNQDRDCVVMQLVNSLSVESEKVNHVSKELVAWFIDWVFDEKIYNAILESLDAIERILGVELESDDDCKIVRSMCKKIHLESILFSLAKNKPEKGYDFETVNNSLVTFFRQKMVKGFDGRGKERISYNEASSSNTASNTAIKIRHDVMVNVVNGDYEKPKKPYIEKIEPEKIEPEKEKGKGKKGKTLSEKQKEKARILAEKTIEKIKGKSDTLDEDIVAEVVEVEKILKS